MKNENQTTRTRQESFHTLAAPFVTLLFIIVIGVLLSVVMPFIVRRYTTEFLPNHGYFDWETLGQFGDSFGLITAICTAGAFGLLWLAYETQRDELREMRKSLDLQRREMELARQSMDMQRHENSLLNLWRFYLENVMEYEFQYTEGSQSEKLVRSVRGPAAIRRALIRAVNSARCQNTNDKKNWKNIEKGLDLGLFIVYKKLLVLLTFLSRSAFGEKEKEEYLDMIRLSISDYEWLMAILISCIQEDNQAKRLVGKYFRQEDIKHRDKSVFDTPIKEVIDAAKV